MENDEKLKAREDEHLPPSQEDEHSSLPEPPEDDQVESSAESQRDAGSNRLEPSFGMPSFDFVSESKPGIRNDGGSSIPSMRSAEVPPIMEGTGWENGASVERMGAVRARIPEATQQLEEAGLNDNDAAEEPDRHEATVMPFPGASVRQPEPSSIDFLRGRDESSFADFSTDLSTDSPPEYEDEDQDTLADAVQSALRNVYGARSGEQWEDSETGSITVADSLIGNDERGEVAWSEESGNETYLEKNETYLENEREEATAEASTEAVLDYLYGRRRGELGREDLTLDTALKDFDGAPAHESGFQQVDDDYAESHVPLYPAEESRETFQARRVEPVRYADAAGQQAAQQWEASPYVGNLPVRTSAGAYASGLPDQGASDSGHLLGAAGLGLIGGIALAGVLAVFVFNSFVDIDQGADQSAPSKVVGQLPPEGVKANVAPQPEKTQIELKPAATNEPRLTARNVIGSPNEPVRLDIAISNQAHAEDSLVSIKGLPKDARLSTGIDVGSGQWLLPPARLKNLTLTLPQGAAGTYNMAVQLLKDDAQTTLSEPVNFTLSTKVASLQGTSTAAGGKLDDPSQETDFLTQMLIRDGNRHMRDGEILAARRLYEQAALSGSPEAALAMGRSFDPTYFEKLNVKTGKPDPAQAFEWYKKALDGGLSTARIKIDALKQWLQK